MKPQKINQKIFTTLSALAVLSLSGIQNAHAGDGKGNGGGLEVCRALLKPGEERGDILSIEMYDLFEGVERYKFAPNYIDGVTYEDYIQNALKRLRDSKMDSLAAKIEAALKLVDQKIELTNDDLEPTIDAVRTRKILGCHYEQQAIWDERTNRIDLDTKLFNHPKMSARDQAALKFHEAVYYLARTYADQTTSDNSREFVARVFLNQTILPELIGFTLQNSASGLTRDQTKGIYEAHWSDSKCYESGKSNPEQTFLIHLNILKTAQYKHSRDINDEWVLIGKDTLVGTSAGDLKTGNQVQYLGNTLSFNNHRVGWTLFSWKKTVAQYELIIENLACGSKVTQSFVEELYKQGESVSSDDTYELKIRSDAKN